MENRMKALVKARPEPGLWMEHVPVPEVGPGEVLIKVRKSAICGTDVHIWKWDEFSAKTVPVPMVVGHEFMGEVVDCGPGAGKYRLGQRVSGEGHIVCNACRNCRAGRGHLCRVRSDVDPNGRIEREMNNRWGVFAAGVGGGIVLVVGGVAGLIVILFVLAN